MSGSFNMTDIWLDVQKSLVYDARDWKDFIGAVKKGKCKRVTLWRIYSDRERGLIGKIIDFKNTVSLTAMTEEGREIYFAMVLIDGSIKKSEYEKIDQEKIGGFESKVDDLIKKLSAELPEITIQIYIPDRAGGEGSFILFTRQSTPGLCPEAG